MFACGQPKQKKKYLDTGAKGLRLRGARFAPAPQSESHVTPPGDRTPRGAFPGLASAWSRSVYVLTLRVPEKCSLPLLATRFLSMFFYARIPNLSGTSKTSESKGNFSGGVSDPGTPTEVSQRRGQAGAGHQGRLAASAPSASSGPVPVPCTLPGHVRPPRLAPAPHVQLLAPGSLCSSLRVISARKEVWESGNKGAAR